LTIRTLILSGGSKGTRAKIDELGGSYQNSTMKAGIAHHTIVMMLGQITKYWVS
jgi:hypothetical protein